MNPKSFLFNFWGHIMCGSLFFTFHFPPSTPYDLYKFLTNIFIQVTP